MRKLLNTLFVTSEDAYLTLDGENVVVNREKQEVARYPLHTLSGIIAFSYAGASPALMGGCAKRGVCGTGIRVSELRFFNAEAVKRGEIAVSCKSKTRTILLPSKLKKMLLDHAKKNGIRSGAIFITRNGKPLDRSNIWAQMKSLCEAAGVKASKVFPHNLRKLFARTFYGIEKEIAKLADILGHSSIDTTRIYIMTAGTEHRRKIERLGLVV